MADLSDRETRRDGAGGADGAGADPIRVLRIIARMNVGGPALQVAALAEGLPPDRVEQRLLVGTVDPGERDYRDLHGTAIDARTVPGLGRAVNPLDDVRAWWTIVRTIRSFRPDIVHTHTAKAGLLGRTAAWLLRVPATAHTFHGHLLYGYFSPRVTRLVAGVERVLASRTTALVAVGSAVRDELVRAGIGTAGRYAIIPAGVDLPSPVDRAAARRHLDLPVDGPVVTFVGRLTAVKRPDRLVEVARRLTAAVPDVHVVVVGDGDLMEDTVARASDLPGVRFLGWRPDTELAYAAADVVLLTSDNEGVPVTLIEAAASGRAAVTTDVGSVRDVVEDGANGFVVAADAGALAGAVQRILDDPDLRTAMEREAARRAARFSRERLVGDHEALYLRLADRSPGVPVRR